MNRRNSRDAINKVPQRGELSPETISKLSHLRRAEVRAVVESRQDRATADSNYIQSAIAHSPGFVKNASFGGAAVLPSTTSQSDRMGPEIYSPLFQLANLNLPRDRVTMNAWNRIFYDTHPIVRNAINLHASYPISKINITCKSKKVQDFFVEMAERIDLYNIVYGVSLEFWKMGEAIPYAELDKKTGTWKRITILNPDYVHIKKSVIGDQTVVSLRPDAALQRVISSNAPSDVALKRRIPRHILDYVKKGQNIPLDSFNASHLKLLSSPYDIRGTSIIVGVYKDLMLYDKLRESKFAQADGMVNPLTLVKLGGSEGYRPTQSDIDAFRTILEEAQYDKDFKIVTHDGVNVERVGFTGDILDIAADIEHINNNLYTGLMVPKALMDQEGVCMGVDSNEILTERGWVWYDDLKEGDKIATVVPDTGELTFHKPTFKTSFDFTGMMFGFKNQEVDIEVTDFHEMFVSRDNGITYNKERALQIFDIDEINSDIKFSSKHKNNIRFKTSINKWVGKKDLEYIEIPFVERYSKEESTKRLSLDDFLEFAGYYLSEGHLRRRYGKLRKDAGAPMGVDITQQSSGKGFDKMSDLMSRMPYSINITGASSNRHSWNIMNKKFAEFILSEFGEKSKFKKIPQWIKSLPQRELNILLDSLILGDGHILKNSSTGTAYYSTISEQLANDVQEIAFKCGYATKSKIEERCERENIFKVAIYKQSKIIGTLRKVSPIVKPTDCSVKWVNDYRVFCVEVPNHIFVTRSNGKIAIHGNTYASSSVGLEVLRQRYDIFRNMIKKWLERKVFAPICEIQDFFEYVDGEKRLIVPTIDFNHMNLYDMSDYIQSISAFVSDNKVSVQTLYRSLGLSYEEEQRRLKEELINNVTRQKEEQALMQMRLNELRNLDADSAIKEAPGEDIPGATLGDDMGGIPGADAGGGGLEGLLGGGGESPMGGGDMMAPEPPMAGGGEGAI